MPTTETTLRPAESTAQDAAIESPPLQVGQWELLNRIGEGRLAQVYQARPLHGAARHALYAAKVLRTEWQADEQIAGLMRREAEVARSVSHPHLISILSAQLQEPPFVLMMPLLAGRSLADDQRRGRRFAIGEALWFARQTAEAMDALLTAGWRHADISPANLFISPDGHVTLLDLGFAQRLDDGGGALDRPLVGTLRYLAPEAFISTLRPDVRSDIYSLGVVLFEMLAGRAPFDGEDPAELIEQHLRQPPCDLRTRHPQLSNDTASLVWKMLSKNPLRRPQTPRELIRLLVRLEIDALPQRIPA